MKTKQAVGALAALAQETRLAAFRLLVQAGPAGLPAGEIAARLGLPAPTASFHLAQLHRAGLLSRRSRGRFAIYSADFARMNALLGFLTENCCGGACSAALPGAVAGRRKAS
jgi:ArsR family transcriptional regulator, arsenate/arsenite/antimonite-responsive transcriptional repressor